MQAESAHKSKLRSAFQPFPRDLYLKVAFTALTGLGFALSIAKIASAQAPQAPQAARAVENATNSRITRHALIIGVGNYGDQSVSRLHGVNHDIENARRMALSMGVPAENTEVLRDQAASHAEIRRALQALSKRVQDGDRAFVYFSGHGTRYPVPESPGSCSEALLPADFSKSRDGPYLTQDEIAADLAPVYRQADKAFVFFDACHSGGVQAANLRSTAPQNAGLLTPKFTALNRDQSHCKRPSNDKRFLEGARTRGAPANNLVQFSSSLPDEVSFDDPSTGGLATSAWMNCVVSADDTDSSGSLSIAEIAACAQRTIEDRIKGHPYITRQTLVIRGNTGFAPTSTGGSGLFQDRLSTYSTYSRFPLDSILAQRDERHSIDVEMARPTLRIGKDYFETRIRSNRGGHLYLILQGTDAESTYVIFPNEIDKDNRIAPDQWVNIPRSTWRMPALGPTGTNRLLVMVTDSPRDMAMLRAKSDGPFVKTLNTMPASRALAWLAGTSMNHASPECAVVSDFSNKGLRNVEQCSDSFGAAIREFEEIK